MSNLQIKNHGLMQMISDGATRVEMIRALANIAVGDIIGAGYPTIAILRRPDQYGEQKVEGAVAGMLIDASSYFEKALDKETALELSIEITVTYYYLTLEDVFACLQQFKRDNHYGKLTPNKILSAVAKYTDERLAIAEAHSLNHHLATQENRVNYDDSAAPANRKEEEFAQFKDIYEKSSTTKNQKLK